MLHTRAPAALHTQWEGLLAAHGSHMHMCKCKCKCMCPRSPPPRVTGAPRRPQPARLSTTAGRCSSSVEVPCSRQPMRPPTAQAQGCHLGPKGEPSPRRRSDACLESPRPLRSTIGASRSAPRSAWMAWEGTTTSTGRDSTRASWSTSSKAWSSAVRSAPRSAAALTRPRRRRCACPRAASARCRRARCRWTPTTGGPNGRAGHPPS